MTKRNRIWSKLVQNMRTWSVHHHYSDVIMSAMASQITSVPEVWSTVCSGADQRKSQSSASLAFVRGIHRWPVDSPHKGPVTREMFPFDDVITRISSWKFDLFLYGYNEACHPDSHCWDHYFGTLSFYQTSCNSLEDGVLVDATYSELNMLGHSNGHIVDISHDVNVPRMAKT